MQKICFFQDFLSDISPYLKERILKENNVEIIDRPFIKNETRLLNQGVLNSNNIVDTYKDFILELKINFGLNAPSALYAMVRNPNNRWENLFSDRSREFLYAITENSGLFSDQLLKWGLDSGNWFLIDSKKSSFELQSEISASFPCLIFENFAIECASGINPTVSLQYVENIIQMTGAHIIWKSGQLGQRSTISVLDTGVENSISKKLGIIGGGVGGLGSIDVDGHGSAIIEMIKAISPDSEIESLKILQSFNNGAIWDLINGLLTFYDKRDHVVCMAFCVSPGWVNNLGASTSSFQESIFKTFESFANNMNFPICAAGNYGLNKLLWPAASKNSLAVGSHNSSHRISSFSNYDSSAQNFILAPGGDKNETDHRLEFYGRYGPALSREVFGTSFSAAITTGIASLLQSYEWFREMKIPSRISLFKNHCKKNIDGFSILNIEDVGAVWPL